MKTADICMILEGTYPFVHGGVSAWVHELISNQKTFTFSLVCIVPVGFEEKPCFVIPENVVGMKVVPLNGIERKKRLLPQIFNGRARAFFSQVRVPLMKLVTQKALLEDFKLIIAAFSEHREHLDQYDLIRSKMAWELLLEIYDATMPEISFLDFFWSWQTLIGGLFSMMMTEIPPARCYHSICTGYAGIMLARAKYEYHLPCILTEHGIYTTERRFEIAFAEWLVDQKSFSMSVNKSKNNYELRDLWTDFFVQYGRFCYQSSDVVVSLFQDNLKIQVAGGADPERCKVIPNGINMARYGAIVPELGHPKTIAFIGRIVPIKDVKTYIRAVSILSRNIPDLEAYIMGGHDEDQTYYEECLELINSECLNDIIKLTGKVNIAEYLSGIDVVVLSSISEAQPLVILEAGASGIPSVATDVGSCREMLEGGPGDDFGHGGIVVPLASPGAMADALTKLLLDDEFYEKCSLAIKQRVVRYYNSVDQFKSYFDLYTDTIACKNTKV